MGFASGTLYGTCVRRDAPGTPHRRARRICAAWIVAGTLALLSGCGQSTTETAKQPAPANPLPPELAAIDGALGPGMELPPLRAEGWINGQSVSNEDLLGSVAVVDVWAYW